jgi:uncharacterized protein YjbI with pentapeptide repeats
MGNSEHVEILNQGVDVWNKWREDNPSIRPDLIELKITYDNLIKANFSNAKLTRADLKGAILIEADFRMADLSYSKLHNTDLSGADLSGANLYNSKICSANMNGAKLIKANLVKSDLDGSALNGSNLSGADAQMATFRGSNLIMVNLSETKLVGVNLSGAILNNSILSNTDLSQAIVGSSNFGNINLSEAKGLPTVNHVGPSTIGLDTFYRSKAGIPEAFLRGAGMPDNLIEYMSSLTGKAFEFYSCFISYSSKDQQFAERLYADLQSNGVRCWFAPEDMKIGDKIWQRIDQSIKIHDKLLLILSENSLGSEWCEDEVEAAYEQEMVRGQTVLFPVRIDNDVMDTDKAWAFKLRRSRHIGDFTNWKDHNAYQKAFDRLLRDLKADD